jgi:two-component system sensor histidine kinase BaeS
VESSRSRATGGAGLGLAICRNIVEAHEGTITAKASPLGGVWVTVRLPVAKGGV